MHLAQKLSLFLYFLNAISQIDSATLQKDTARIIGGENARVDQFRFATAVHVQTSTSKFFCGGTLTGNDWVITSGHCVYDAVLFIIQLGSHKLVSEDSNRLTVSTSTYMVHPDFKPDTIEHDIGIIKFRKPIDYNMYITPIYAMDWPLEDYSNAYIIGWGQTSDDNPELSNDLQYSYITTISNLECQTFYGNQITPNMVCISGNYNQGTCIGDNGSPLLLSLGKTYGLVGVASFVSSGGCESIHPSGYTRTYPYREWIRNNTKPDENE